MRLRFDPTESIRTIPQPTTVQGSHFRELVPIEQWSGFVYVKDIPQEEFKNRLIGLSNELGFRFSGWFVFNNPNNKNTDFYYFLDRHPQRKKYGPTKSIEEYKDALVKLAQAVNSESFTESYEGNQFRVLLGLRKGYDLNSEDYSIEDDVKSRLKEGFTFEEAEIFSTVPDRPPYTENAVLITGDLSRIDEVYLLAEELQQERFTIEELGNRTTYTVETKHCTEPDG